MDSVVRADAKKCKNIDKSYNLFCRWNQKELGCYSVMIDGRGIHKCIAKEIKLFEEIQEANSNEHPITELYRNISFLSIVGHGDDFRTYCLLAKNSYSPTHWQIKMLVHCNDSKAEHPHLEWEKPLHVLILKSAFKVFDPGICLPLYLPSN
ncbi:Pentatricopeptide repeat-containing protein [Dendrobium catenatum]|uniref:Pentatricopeptide repeat-containing protein n=1 Tax=Dendrobium catenatum TaxID=906689 RepID=A0A2I0W009_9ASPA|nr:Pentatricopeptide repeat-containing protein [Dendrobium catenatum]